MVVGKAAAMLSFVNLLHSSGERDIRFNFSEPVKNNNWDSKIIVDPSVFDGVHNIGGYRVGAYLSEL